MYYKLFHFGSKRFTLVRIFGELVKKDDILTLEKDYRVKVLEVVRSVSEVLFNPDGVQIHDNFKEDKESLSNSNLPEIYVTQIPNL